MHEYTLMENVIETVETQLARQGLATPGSVEAIRFRVGMLEMHSPESFRQAFEWITRGTVLDGARLDFEIVPSRIECAKCGHAADLEVGDADCHDPSPVIECPNCGAATVVQGGRGVAEIELILKSPVEK